MQAFTALETLLLDAISNYFDDVNLRDLIDFIQADVRILKIYLGILSIAFSFSFLGVVELIHLEIGIQIMCTSLVTVEHFKDAVFLFHVVE